MPEPELGREAGGAVIIILFWAFYLFLFRVVLP